MVTKIQVEHVHSPAADLYCKEAPPVPVEQSNKAVWGDYVTDLLVAGQDCRDKVKDNKKWQDSHP